MKKSGNTILITGGASGIGLALSEQFIARGNTVIITGRDAAKLAAAKAQLPQLVTFQSDVSDTGAIEKLFADVTAAFPKLNVLVNNAGIMRKMNLNDNRALSDVTQEIDTNLNGPIRMVQQFLPHLKAQANAAIINVSSGLAFVPLPISPVYSSTKAALHSYTLSLRQQLANSSVEVIELAPPGTETPLFRDGFTAEDLKDIKAMDVKTLALKTMEGLDRGATEIRPGLSNMLKIMSRVAPGFALSMLSKSVGAMLAKK